jgi:hypothetical protein
MVIGISNIVSLDRAGWAELGLERVVSRAEMATPFLALLDLASSIP